MESIVLFSLFILIPLFYYRVIKKKTWDEIKKELLPKNKELKKELIGSLKLFGILILGFLVIATTISAIEIIFNIQINDMDNVANFIKNGFITPIFFILSLTIIVFIEEFFFRAFLQKNIGILFSTIIFTFFHLGYESITQTIGVFFLGLILAYWFKKNNSIIQNYFGHLLYNLLAVILYLI
ncbi:MAG: CPBP family intramembrane metalloprotease [Candidatus ainarchaeum sp.]|nr:CPBP family intramembrane metalloprotease [Candidatus ainarchaeum sp.]